MGVNISMIVPKGAYAMKQDTVRLIAVHGMRSLGKDIAHALSDDVKEAGWKKKIEFESHIDTKEGGGKISVTTYTTDKLYNIMNFGAKPKQIYPVPAKRKARKDMLKHAGALKFPFCKEAIYRNNVSWPGIRAEDYYGKMEEVVGPEAEDRMGDIMRAILDYFQDPDAKPAWSAGTRAFRLRREITEGVDVYDRARGSVERRIRA